MPRRNCMTSSHVQGLMARSIARSVGCLYEATSLKRWLCIYAPTEECCNCHHKGEADYKAWCIASAATTTANAAIRAAVHVQHHVSLFQC